MGTFRRHPQILSRTRYIFSDLHWILYRYQNPCSNLRPYAILLMNKQYLFFDYIEFI